MIEVVMVTVWLAVVGVLPILALGFVALELAELITAKMNKKR